MHITTFPKTMKKRFLQIPLYFLLLTLVLISCNSGLDDVEVPESENDYLIETELVESYPLLFIQTFLQLAATEYPEIEEFNDQFISGVDVYKIVYNTEFNGETIKASGLVCLPTSSGTYPVLSYQNGTNTLHDAAPSVDPNNELFSVLEMMSSTGFIITIPDYLGFGESDNMFHPYLHKESTVQTVTDMLKAVDEFIDGKEEISTDHDLYIAGYSQGGWATMAMQENLNKQNSTNFNLKASACGAGPHNLITINEYVTGLEEYTMPYFLGYIFNSYINIGLTTTYDEVFQQPYADRIPTLYDGSKTGVQINDQLTNVVSDLFTDEYLSGWNTSATFSPVVDYLEENSIEAWATTTPTMLLHGTADELVPPIVTENLYNDFISEGVSSSLVTRVELEDMSHTSGILPSGLASIIWFISLREATS